ncbi:hypothetical protein BDN67DRAFT_561441 [Paxillus ammoniavirescens]|nr:hypothetical protein BDN67DRAFT_561441 [Paxillus ammoniavirescens]
MHIYDEIKDCTLINERMIWRSLCNKEWYILLVSSCHINISVMAVIFTRRCYREVLGNKVKFL